VSCRHCSSPFATLDLGAYTCFSPRSRAALAYQCEGAIRRSPAGVRSHAVWKSPLVSRTESLLSWLAKRTRGRNWTIANGILSSLRKGRASGNKGGASHATVDGDSPSRVNEVLIAPSGEASKPSALPHLHMSSAIVLPCATRRPMFLLVTPGSSLDNIYS
jgi:hypothetical protein